MSQQTTGCRVLSWFPFYLFLEVFDWLGPQRVAPFYRQHLDLTQALERYHFQFGPPLSLVSLSLDFAVVREEDELEEDVEQCLSCVEGVLEVD